MKRIIIGDPHIEEKSIPELTEIFEEILQYDADEFICLGDWFHKKRPSPLEIEFGTRLVYRLKQNYSKVHILEGNHDRISEDLNNIKYLEYMGIETHPDIWYEKGICYGHLFVEGSKDSFGKAELTLSDLNNSDLIFLGHQHSFQKLTNSAWHLGSIRYVGFGEADDDCKKIALLSDEKQSVTFIDLKSPIPMKDVTTINVLKKTSPDTKVRMVFKTFEQFKKEINLVQQYKDFFYDPLKIKLDFQPSNELEIEDVEDTSLALILENWLTTIEDGEVKAVLSSKFNYEN